MPAQFLAYLRVELKSIRAMAPASEQLPSEEDEEPPPILQASNRHHRNLERNMHLSSIHIFGFLLLNLQLVSSYPISTGLTDTDVDVLKVLLRRLEDSVSEQTAPAERDGLDLLNTEDAADGQQAGPDQAAIREFFSAKNLKSIRSDQSRKQSSCFGRRMDRIGSMSSLGCNTVGKYSPK